MKRFFIFWLLLPFVAMAEIPWDQLDVLRQQSVAIRVAMDFPESPVVKNCNSTKSLGELGTKYSKMVESAMSDWKKMKLGPGEINELAPKVKNCKSRGSCDVYDTFLSSVQAPPALKPKVKELRKQLSASLATIKSNAYLEAWKTIPDACNVLRDF